VTNIPLLPTHTETLVARVAELEATLASVTSSLNYWYNEAWKMRSRVGTLTDELASERHGRGADQSKIEALRAALTPFAAFAELSGASRLPDDHAITQGSRLAAPQITVGHLRKARAALEVK